MVRVIEEHLFPRIPHAIQPCFACPNFGPLQSEPAKTGRRRGREEKEPPGLKRKDSKPERLIEVDRALVLRIHHDRENSDRTPGPQNPLDRIGQEQLTDTLPPDALVTCKPTDQGSRNRVVARQLVGQLFRQALERERQRAQTAEANDTQIRGDGNEDPCDVPLLVLARPPPEPIVEIRLAAREARPIVMFTERLDHDLQDGSTLHLSMASQRGDELLGGLGRIHHGGEECIPVRSEEHEAFMRVEYAASSFVGQIAGCQPGNSHRALDQQLGRGRDAELDALFLELPIG